MKPESDTCTCNKSSTGGYLVFSADRHVFNLLTILGLVFLTLYILGTSLPGWFIIDEFVNTSTCASANEYMYDNMIGSKDDGYSRLYVSSSLWYLRVHLDGVASSSSKFLPFLFLSKMRDEDRHVLCSGLMGIITFTLLGLGVLFTLSASTKPSKMIYYGLSQVTIVTAASTWMLASFEASQAYVTSVAKQFCLDYVILSTSLSLQILTGACAVLAFIMGCILIHLATIFTSNIKCQQKYSHSGDVLKTKVPYHKECMDDDQLIIL